MVVDRVAASPAAVRLSFMSVAIWVSQYLVIQTLPPKELFWLGAAIFQCAGTAAA